MHQHLKIYRAYGELTIVEIDSSQTEPWSSQPLVLRVRTNTVPIYTNENESWFVAEFCYGETMQVVWNETTERWYGIYDVALNNLDEEEEEWK